MKVKRYIAENTQEAVSKIKKDLGNNAVILNTRKIRKGTGLIKYFTKPLVEILAASDDTPRNNDNMAKGWKDSGVWSNGVQPMVETRHISSLERRVDDINATLTKLYNKIYHLQGGNDYPDNVQQIVDRLMENEVAEEIILPSSSIIPGPKALRSLSTTQKSSSRISLAIKSASMIYAPNCFNISDAVLLPEAIPPVKPITFILIYHLLCTIPVVTNSNIDHQWYI
jgi:hypothetical protein